MRVRVMPRSPTLTRSAPRSALVRFTAQARAAGEVYVSPVSLSLL